MKESRFSGLQVSQNAGINFIWAECSLLIIGLSMVFYFPFRQLWMLFEPKGNNESHLIMRCIGKASLSMEEISDLVIGLKKDRIKAERK